jgi:hypothetical protein
MKKQLLMLDTRAWLTDLDLRACLPEDRSHLLDLMCIAEDGKPKGFVTLGNGTAVPDGQIARMMNIDEDAWMAARDRLIASKRIHRTESGSIYIARMVRDAEIAASAKEGGARGGNPNIVTGRKAPRAKAITLKFYLSQLPDSLADDADVRDAVGEWLEYRDRKRFVLTTDAVDRQVSKLRHLKPEQAAMWLRCAVDKQWRGLYPPPAQYMEEIDEKARSEATKAGIKKAKEEQVRKRRAHEQRQRAIEEAVDQVSALRTKSDRARLYTKLRDQHGKKFADQVADLVAFRAEMAKKHGT